MAMEPEEWLKLRGEAKMMTLTGWTVVESDDLQRELLWRKQSA